jgi:hypothetical protein
MCAACVAQGAAYLVPAYAVVKTTTWQRKRRATKSSARVERPEDKRAPVERPEDKRADVLLDV